MIDLNSSITFQDSKGDDFNLNTLIGTQLVAGGGVPLSGYIVSGFGIGSVAPIGYEDPKATADGIDASEAYAGRRLVSVSLDIYGSTRSDLFQKMQNIVNTMRFMPKRYERSDGFRYLKASMLTTDANYPINETTGLREIPIQFLARPYQIPQTESTGTQFSGSDSLGYSAKMVLYFLLKYPFKYAQLANEDIIPIDGTDYAITNHGSAPAETQVAIEGIGTKADDIIITVTLASVPLTITMTETLGDDSGITRSILIDYKEQIVYIVEYDQDTEVTTSRIAMNLMDINSGALFATVEPTADLTEPAAISVVITDTSDNPITTGYHVTLFTRESWY